MSVYLFSSMFKLSLDVPIIAQKISTRLKALIYFPSTEMSFFVSCQDYVYYSKGFNKKEMRLCKDFYLIVFLETSDLYLIIALFYIRVSKD